MELSLIAVFVCMVFCHIIDDYYLQGWLASAKQKTWWEKNAPDPLYKHDYICALICHATSWSTSIMLPILIYEKGNLGWIFIAFWLGNILIHSLVDMTKANWKKINLIEDQLCHLAQIIITFSCFAWAFGCAM